MRKKLVFCFLIIAFLVSNINSQQRTYLKNYLPIDAVTSENIFFNRKNINPSLSNDTITIKASFFAHYQWLGLTNSPRNYSFSCTGKIPKTASIIGMDLVYSGSSMFKNQTLKINHSYKINLNNKSNLKIGTNLGVSRFKDYPVVNILSGALNARVPNWIFRPNLDIGLTYNRLSQNIGISYLNLFKSYIKHNSYQYVITDNILIVNYFSSYKLFNSIKILPELIIFNESHKTNFVIKGILSFHDKLQTGLFISNSLNDVGLVINSVIFKYFEIGYLFEINKDELHKYTFGSHTLKLGIIIN